MDDNVTNSRQRIIEAITSPLGFCVLSLLIVEGFIGAVLIAGRNVDPITKHHGMWIGSFLFLVVMALVFLLIWFRPTNLVYGEKSHLEQHSPFEINASLPTSKSNLGIAILLCVILLSFAALLAWLNIQTPLK